MSPIEDIRLVASTLHNVREHIARVEPEMEPFNVPDRTRIFNSDEPGISSKSSCEQSPRKGIGRVDRKWNTTEISTGGSLERVTVIGLSVLLVMFTDTS